MSACWSQGELRAWLDGELPARDMEAVAAHRKQCAACAGVLERLAAREAWVSARLRSLPETSGLVKLPRISRPTRPLWPVTAAAGIAATLAVVLLAPRQHAPVPQPKPPQMASKAAPALPAPAPPMKVKQAIIRRKLPPKPQPRVEDYVALDDEPIESGVVVRVSLEAGIDGGQVPADVILGPDGRARAIRLVTDFSGGRP